MNILRLLAKLGKNEGDESWFGVALLVLTAASSFLLIYHMGKALGEYLYLRSPR